MTNVVSTWFYVQGSDEGGKFAQLREDSASEKFRDIYRRCIAVFFFTARRANPDARLILYLNQPWAASDTRIATEVGVLLDKLAVEQRVIPYLHEPPASFTESWRNQFFVIDVLHDLEAALGSDDSVVVLDSDVVWTTRSRAQSFWEQLALNDFATYEVGYEASRPVNGLSIENLRGIAERIGTRYSARISYCGGEIVGASGSNLNRLSLESERVWSQLMALHSKDSLFAFEEAHVLSLAYASLGHEPGSCDAHIRRLWTQPFKPKNVTTDDLSLTLWHAPAEKKYGFMRVYRSLIRGELNQFLSEPDDLFISRIAGHLGIPKNSVSKFVRDTSRALLLRLGDSSSLVFLRRFLRLLPGKKQLSGKSMATEKQANS